MRPSAKTDTEDSRATSATGGVRGPPATQENLLLRLGVEHFLFEEAAHLDNWRLDEWLALFTEDARYVVPATDLPNGDPRRDLMLIDDDTKRLRGRVARLKSRYAHREYPSSRTRRLISNVRVSGATAEAVEVRASFIVYRFRNGNADPFIGQYRYTLVPAEGSFKIKARRAELDLETLSPNGAVSMIL